MAHLTGILTEHIPGGALLDEIVLVTDHGTLRLDVAADVPVARIAAFLRQRVTVETRQHPGRRVLMVGIALASCCPEYDEFSRALDAFRESAGRYHGFVEQGADESVLERSEVDRWKAFSAFTQAAMRLQMEEREKRTARAAQLAQPAEGK